MSSTRSTLESIDRDARALAALDDAPLTYSDYADAVAETSSSAMPVGQYAAGSWTALEVASSDPVGTGAGRREVAVHITSTTATIATLASTGQVVVVTGPVRGGSSRTLISDDRRDVADPRDLPGGPVEPTETTTTEPSGPPDPTQPTNPEDLAASAVEDEARAYMPSDSPLWLDPIGNDLHPDARLHVDWSACEIVNEPSHGSAELEQHQYGSLIYWADPGFYGNDHLTYRWCYQNGSCATGTVTVTVVDASWVAEATDQQVVAFPGETITVNLAEPLGRPFGSGLDDASLVPGDGLYTSLAGEGRCSLAVEMTCDYGTGTFDAQDGVFTFTPNEQASGLELRLPYAVKHGPWSYPLTALITVA